MDNAVRQLTRSRINRYLGGVCGGFARFMGWDSTLVRLAFVVMTILMGGLGGIILYILAWILMPLAEPGAALSAVAAPARLTADRTAVGAALLVIGALGLLGSFALLIFHWPFWLVLAPVLFVAGGLILLLGDRDESYSPAAVVVPSPQSESAGGTGANAPRLVRIRRGRKIAGVSTGIGAYLGIDPTIVRLLWIVLILAWGVGALLYLILWVVMPLED